MYTCGIGKKSINDSCVTICEQDIYKCVYGNCYSHLNGTATCICNQDDDYFYTGKTCDVRTEKIQFKPNYIIAAACGSIGFVIIVAVIVCIVCRQKATGDKDKTDMYITEHDTLSYNHPTGLLGRQRTPSNLYSSMHESTYNADNRNYKLVDVEKNSRGNTYMYNPSADQHLNTEIDSRSDKAYHNTSFCSEEFAIKRPQIGAVRDYTYNEYNRPKQQRPDYM
ncbi:uncharacterized protein LOC134695540 [Mytilus trossulus]|uniref:uncharacterized protein LOC134695540 n=1 Tax=Mytilus trossulus TaxID=6551 RepID=UPI003007B51A